MSHENIPQGVAADGPAHQEEAGAHALVAGAIINRIRSVSWGEGTNGVLGVAAPLSRACTFFVIAGLTFRIQAGVGATSFAFSYSGPKPGSVLRNLLTPGQDISLQ